MWCVRYLFLLFVFFSSRRRHTRCALVTGVQTCALPISDAVAAQDRGGEIPDDHPATRVAEGHVLRLDHLLAGCLALRDLHAHVAGQFAALAAFAAHRFEPAHSTLVAGTARLDALADPGFLLCQQLVETRALLHLRIQPLLAARSEE